MHAVNREIFVRSALSQALLVAVLSALLALALGGHFFADWGWLVGPAAWMACSLLTARLLALPLARTLLGAILAGLPSIPAIVLGAHWLGDAVAIALFALWCARTAPRASVLGI
jgi:hypothetical protein